MKLIIGKINASGTIGYWKAGEGYTPDVIAGDYAIVENKNDYDLVKILGIVETNGKYEKFFAQNGVSKQAIRYLARCQVRKD